jgi:hypothetical protein
MSKKLTKLFMVALCFSSEWDVQALLLPAPTPALLPIPQRPTTFPLQRPTRVCAVVAWGENNFGQCTVPDVLSNVVQVAAGEAHTVALKADGIVVAWGWNGHGQCTVPDGLTNVVQVAAGADHTVALKADGTVVAWGRWDSDQYKVPEGLYNVVQVTAGLYHGVALKSDGTVIEWGGDFLAVHQWGCQMSFKS